MEYYSAIKKEQTNSTHDMSESRNHYAEPKKPDIRDHIQYNFIPIKS